MEGTARSKTRRPAWELEVDIWQSGHLAEGPASWGRESSQLSKPGAPEAGRDLRMRGRRLWRRPRRLGNRDRLEPSWPRALEGAGVSPHR